MKKLIIAVLFMIMALLNVSAVKPLETEVEIDSPIEVEPFDFEEKFPLEKEIVYTYLDIGIVPEAFPDTAREAQAQLKAEIEAEEKAAKSKKVSYTKTTTKAQKATSGKMTVVATAYTHTGNPCSTGVMPQENRTVAVDPNVIPYGTRIRIGDDVYVAEDCGSAIKGNRIDIFLGNESQCDDFGVKELEIEVLE